MAVYAIGDRQGCFEPLERLVEAIHFDRSRDRLWFVGDLVNRGPDSLACLRYVKSLGDAAVTVLGNHDLHLLCVAEGIQKSKRRDTLEQVLDAPDRGELVDWLRHRALMHVEGGIALVHAALLPEWTVAKARALAAEVEAALRGRDYRSVLERMYGDEPDRWRDDLAGIDRLRVVINAMTRLRVRPFASIGSPNVTRAMILRCRAMRLSDCMKDRSSKAIARQSDPSACS